MNPLHFPTSPPLSSSLSPLLGRLSTIFVAWNNLLRKFWTRSQANFWRPTLAFLIPFFVYWFTLAPTIYNLDSAELTTATVTGGLMRATGYPLYLLLGRLWAFLPFGDVGYRMNLFSAFNGALTIFFIERIMSRLKVGNWAAFGALSLMMAAPFFWSLSLVAEVYTLHTALMGLIVLLLLDWGKHPFGEGLAVITLVLGLSMGHHLATVLLVPGAAWYVIVTHPKIALTPRGVFLALAGGILGLSVYLYLPLRYLNNPTFNYAGTYDAMGIFHPVNLASPSGLWWLITGKSFAAQMFAYHGPELWNELVWFVGHLTRAFSMIGIGPGILGLILLWRRNWRLAGMLSLMFAFSAFFYIDYRVMDKETMFLPTYVIWTIWLGVGAQWLLEWVGEVGTTAMQYWNPRILQALIVFTVLGAIVYTGPKVNLSNDWTARARGEIILRNVAPNAIVFGWWDTIPVIQYLQLVEGQRPDVQTINRFLISYEDMTTFVQSEIQSHPIYINEVPGDWAEIYSTQQVGPVSRVALPGSGEKNAIQP